jgi:hypothetical protein
MKIRIRGVCCKAVPLSGERGHPLLVSSQDGTRIPHDPLTPEFMAIKRNLDAGKIKPTVATGSVAALIRTSARAWSTPASQRERGRSTIDT